MPTAASRPFSFFVRARCDFIADLVSSKGAMHVPRAIRRNSGEAANRRH